MAGNIIDWLHDLRDDANGASLAVIRAKREPTEAHLDEAWRLTQNVTVGLDVIAELVEERAFPRQSIIKRLSFLIRGHC